MKKLKIACQHINNGPYYITHIDWHAHRGRGHNTGLWFNFIVWLKSTTNKSHVQICKAFLMKLVGSYSKFDIEYSQNLEVLMGRRQLYTDLCALGSKLGFQTLLFCWSRRKNLEDIGSHKIQLKFNVNHCLKL